ncbi:hypothetical protein ACFX19_002608 [Malus domestica]
MWSLVSNMLPLYVRIYVGLSTSSPLRSIPTNLSSILRDLDLIELMIVFNGFQVNLSQIFDTWYLVTLHGLCLANPRGFDPLMLVWVFSFGDGSSGVRRSPLTLRATATVFVNLHQIFRKSGAILRITNWD